MTFALGFILGFTVGVLGMFIVVVFIVKDLTQFYKEVIERLKERERKE